jgi:hypothetical protein
MATAISHSDQSNKSIFSFYADSFIDTSRALARVSTSCAQLSIILSTAFAQSYPIYLNTISEYNKSWKNLSELDKVLRSRFRKAFDEKFREADFINTLCFMVNFLEYYFHSHSTAERFPSLST